MVLILHRKLLCHIRHASYKPSTAHWKLHQHYMKRQSVRSTSSFRPSVGRPPPDIADQLGAPRATPTNHKFAGPGNLGSEQPPRPNTTGFSLKRSNPQTSRKTPNYPPCKSNDVREITIVVLLAFFASLSGVQPFAAITDSSMAHPVGCSSAVAAEI
jgi:hypothetical protein